MENILFLKILIPTLLSFLVGIAITPSLTRFFYKHKLWKKSSRTSEENDIGDLEMNKDFVKVHNSSEVSTPRIGGSIVWASVFIVTIICSLLAIFYPNTNLSEIGFINRSQTWVPLLAMFMGAGIGLVDDLLQVIGKSHKNLTLGIPRRIRILSVLVLGILGALWFYLKLGHNSIPLPGDGEIMLGWIFIPFFVFTFLSLFSSSVIDGIDGLAGGVLSIIFTSYGFIGVLQNQFDIAAFSFVVAGALLAFLWFNIPPARFYLGETGILALTFTLATLIFLTNTVVEFLLIGLPLVLTAFSSLAQIISRRFFGFYLFKVAPLHHHFEALGWSREKITMRYWVFSTMCAISGIILLVIV